MSNFTNSPLASIRNTSHNKINGSGSFTRRITKITIHHAAGVINGQNLLNWGHNPKCGASWQYGIGNDGVIGQMTEERHRAWTSSSPSNDYQAVTIEVSNSATGGEWPVGDKAYNALLDLCADICRRNGISKLTFDGTPNGSLTHHSMFAATSCPGKFLLDRFTAICDEVNRRLGSQPADPPAPEPAPVAPPENAGDIKAGGVVDFKEYIKAYYPGGPEIPAWVKSDFYHVVTRTESGGKPVVKGGAACVLLGRKINKKTGKEDAGINTWVNVNALNSVSNGEMSETKEIDAGDVVAIRNGTELYHPGGAKIPAWAILDQYHKVTQILSGGKPVVRGGKTCVLLGRRVDKTRGTESAGINTWIDRDALIIIRKGG